MRKQKGFIGIIAILIVVVIAAIWMAYLFKHNWFGAPNISGSEDTNVQKDVPAQLDDLRANMKTIQDQQDQKIKDAMGGK
jgi:hypothetical protein